MTTPAEETVGHGHIRLELVSDDGSVIAGHG